MPRKRRRLAPSNVGDSAEASSRATMTGFGTLPFELRLLVVELACQPGDGLFSGLERKRTLLSLSLSSRALYIVTQPIMLRRVNVAAPSRLYALWRLLATRPELGKLIRELHIGLQHIVESGWWPLDHANYNWDQNCFENRLVTRLRDRELPAGWSWYKAWHLCATPKTCREAAISNALAVAEGHLAPHLVWKTGFPQGRALLPKVFEFQAVLELYLIELRRLEDLEPARKEVAWRKAPATEKCRQGICRRYPTLVIDGGTRRSSRRHALVLTLRQIHQHPFRRDGSADNFDHPLLYVRSGVPVTYNRSEITMRAKGHVGHASCFIGTDEWEQKGAKDLIAFVRGGCQHEDVQPIDDSSSMPPPTLKIILSWARAILACATRVEKLSLTGYLGQVTCSGHDLPSVRRLSVGPAPSFLRSRFELSGFRGVKVLRLCAARISPKDVECLASTRLLEKMTWISPIRQDMTSASDMIATLNKLIGRKIASDDENLSRTRESSAETSVANLSTDHESSTVANKAANVPLIEVRMDRSNIDWMLAMAPTAEVKKAWLTGTPLPDGRRRLLLLECKETVDREEIVNECGWKRCGRVWLSHHLEAKEWWQEERPGASV